MAKSKRSGKVYKKKSVKKQVKVNKSDKNVDSNNVIARCMKCKKQMKMENAKQVTLKNGRNAMKGNCVCGTTMFKFV